MPKDNSQPARRILTVMEGREENRRMVDGFASAAKRRGWGFYQMQGINSDRLARYDFKGIPLDYVIFRELSGNNYHEAERLMYWLKFNHKTCINVDVAGRRMSTSDKHFQQGLFMLDPFIKQYAVPTFEAKFKENVLAYLKAGRVHYPIILKDRRGTAGANITLIRGADDLDGIKDFRNLLIEQYIQPECDYRVFVIGGVAVGIMRKKGDTSKPGDFVAWSAGKKKYAEEDANTISQLSEIATRAAAISKLEYAGVDIIKEAETGKYYLLETNIAAGWGNSFIEVTHVDIPSLTLDWFEDIDKGKAMPTIAAVSTYIENRLRYLPPAIQESYGQILKGVPKAHEPYREIFAKYPDAYLYDAGNIYSKLSHAYRNLTEENGLPADYRELVAQIESMPLSWAGNFIGPSVGTLHDGAILSALYLFLLHKTEEV